MDEPDISAYTFPAGFTGKSTQDVREMMKRARDGSFEDMKYLAVSGPSIPTELIGEALQVFCKFLDVTPAQLNIAPCSIYTPAVTLQYGFGIMALNGMGSISRPPSLSVLSCVEKSWPNIREWAKFYYEDKLSGGPVWTVPPKDKRIETLAEAQSLAVLVGVFAFSTTFRLNTAEKFAKDRGETFKILARVWLRATQHEHVEMEAKRRLVEIFKSALTDFFNSSKKEWSLNKARDIIFSESKKKPHLVADTALAFIKDAPSFIEPGLVLPSVNTTYLLLCAGAENKKEESTVFEKAFLEAKVSQIVTRIFVYFSSPPNDKYRHAEGILNNCLLTIVGLLESPCGFAQAPMMLKCGLLGGIANYVSNFYTADRSTVDPFGMTLRTIVGHLLPHYLIHYAVLGAAIQATRDIIRSKNLNVLEKSMFALEWTYFYNLLLERAAIKSLYDINLKNRNHLCGGSEKKFQTCSGCKTAIYCSRDCQKRAWKDKSHKLECETLKSFTGDKYFNLHSTLFLPSLVSFDLRRFAPGIEAHISRHPDLRAAGSDIGYAVKYLEDDSCIPTLQIFPFRASSISNNPLLAFVNDSSSTTNDNATRIDNAFKRLEKNQRIVHVTFYRGGMYKENALYLHDALVEGTEPGGPSGTSNIRRRIAMDDKRKDIAWTWDKVDTIMFKALQATEGSPKKSVKSKETVFDLISKYAKEIEEQSESNDLAVLVSPASILHSSARNTPFLELRILSAK